MRRIGTSDGVVFEIELKFPVADAGVLRRRLLERGARVEKTEEQRDTYYNHPCRDFRETTEALRIRRIDGEPVVTYKGAKRPGAVKTRRELEWSLAPGDPDGRRLAELLECLGFRSEATVVKRRESFSLAWQGRAVTVTIDAVEGLGTFAEFERVAAEEAVEEAREDVLALARDLTMGEPEPRSYLRMVLEAGRKGVE